MLCRSFLILMQFHLPTTVITSWATRALCWESFPVSVSTRASSVSSFSTFRLFKNVFDPLLNWFFYWVKYRDIASFFCMWISMLSTPCLLLCFCRPHRVCYCGSVIHTMSVTVALSSTPCLLLWLCRPQRVCYCVSVVNLRTNVLLPPALFFLLRLI